MNSKKWFKRLIGLLAVFLAAAAVLAAGVDPMFHFHGPLPYIQYRLGDERSVNDGITRNFEYDSVIIGTSMTENFKTSEFNQAFGADSIKIPFSGAGYKELSENLERAFKRKKNISLVLWGLDYNCLANDKDWSRYSSCPEYLYNDNPWDDISYILNKKTLFQALGNLLLTIRGGRSTTMDEYASWSYPTGKEAVLSAYERPPLEEGKSGPLTQEQAAAVEESIKQNVEGLIKEQPDTRFLLFFTPYSIVYWDSLYRTGEIGRQIEREKIAAERLLSYGNVELYCFFDETDIICNLDYYKDPGHYSSEINSEIIERIKNGENRITKENYMVHIQHMKEFYKNYSYDSIFQ